MSETPKKSLFYFETFTPSNSGEYDLQKECLRKTLESFMYKKVSEATGRRLFLAANKWLTKWDTVFSVPQ